MRKRFCAFLPRQNKSQGGRKLCANYFILETIACTGIRISELKYFTVERIKRGKIEIYNKGKYRKIFLPKLLRENLLNYCKEHGIKTGWGFITKTFPHNLRHLFARSYYEDTKDLAGLADLLGYSSVDVTRIYTSTTESVFQKRIDRFIKQKILGVQHNISHVVDKEDSVRYT